jgi:probable rRNA maturation factor
MSKTKLFYLKRGVRLKNRSGLKAFIETIFKKEGVILSELRIIFSSDKHLLSINKSYLKHNYYTDIITFNLSGPNEKKIDAEIYISVDRVRDNAKTNQVSFNRELHRVIFHGVLHLCGYNDKLKSQQLIMRAKEDEYLSRYFVH